MAKKKKVVRKTKTSWVWQKLGWLAGLFGLAIAVFSVVLYRQQTAAYPPILEAGDATIVKEWEFDGGVEGWTGKTHVEGYCDDTNLGFGTYSGGTPKKCTEKEKEGSGAPINLTASGGYLKFGQATTGTTIYSRDLNINASNANFLAVEVVMKAEFEYLTKKNTGAVTKNTAELTIIGKTGKMARRASATLDSDGEAVYRFEFTKQELNSKSNEGVVRGLNFNPTRENNILLKNVMIDSITVLSE